MIKYRIKVKYRDDKEEVFECYDTPINGDNYLVVFLTPTLRKYVPQQAISSFTVEDYWAGKK